MRLIDADALKTKKVRSTDRHEWVVPVAEIDWMPTIEERKTGKWIEQDDGWDGVYYECSCCKEAFTLIDGTPSDNLYNFCPNCGADMRGGDHDKG